MSDNLRYCLGCMKPIDSQAIICPHCHYSDSTPTVSSHLRPGTLIAGRYLIGKATVSSKDSITYIALDKTNEQVMSVCELYPASIVTRDAEDMTVRAVEGKHRLFESCLESFTGLWRGLKVFDDVGCLPCVADVIKENGTAYALCKNKNTVALKDYFSKTRRPLTPAKAIAAFLPLLNALKLLHNAGIVHGNLSPATIQVGSDGRLNLTGFSIPQCRSDIPELTSKPAPGFSPIEFYRGGASKPQSDIYSIMAVMYYAVTGTVLARATDREHNSKLTMPSSVIQNVSRPLLDAFSRSLAVEAVDRPARIDDVIALLKSATVKPSGNTVAPSAAPVRKPKTDPSPAPAEPSEEAEEDDYEEDMLVQRKEPSLALISGVTCVAVVLVCLIIFCALYSTVLYKSIDIPVLDRMFSSMSFLPMNRDEGENPQASIYGDDNPPVSGDSSYVTVPDFTGYTEEEIRNDETIQTNFVIVFKSEASETVEQGKVIKQSIQKNESVVMGTRIIVTLSSGKPEKTVPDVLGYTYEEAVKELEKHGFKASKQILDNKDNKKPNTVSNMSIESGKTAAKGTEIVLYVWDEPEVTTTAPTTTAPTTAAPTTTAPTTAAPTTTAPTTTAPTTAAPTTTAPTTAADTGSEE